MNARIVNSAVILYLGIMAYIVLAVLNEVRPMWYYTLSATLFVLSQLDYFLLNKIICRVGAYLALGPWSTANTPPQSSSHKIDGSFVATVLETAAIGVLFLAWKNITEGESAFAWTTALGGLI
jgi:hypothetical protein